MNLYYVLIDGHLGLVFSCGFAVNCTTCGAVEGRTAGADQITYLFVVISDFLHALVTMFVTYTPVTGLGQKDLEILKC